MGAKVEATSIELAPLFVVEVGRVQLSEDGHGCDPVEDRGVCLKVTAVAEADKREDALAHEGGA
jgi:hypothetical protein